MENENQYKFAHDTNEPPNGYIPKKDEKAVRQEQRERSKKWKGRMYWGIPLLIVIGITIWLLTLPRKPQSPAVKGKNHIHAVLAITLDGTPVTIPGGIGLGPGGSAVHIPGAQQVIHTHVENDQLHIEAVTSGPLREDDTRVSTFFRIWGKEFNSTAILDKTTLAGGTLQFKVNGTDNAEFQNYQMRDGDKLEIIFISGAGTAAPNTASSSNSS